MKITRPFFLQFCAPSIFTKLIQNRSLLLVLIFCIVIKPIFIDGNATWIHNHLVRKRTPIWPIWPNGWVFLYELIRVQLQPLKLRYSTCFEQRVPWHSKLCCKLLYPTETVKYLGVKFDTNLSWQCHINDLSIKLNSTLVHNCHGNKKKIKKISQMKKFCSIIKTFAFI